MPIETIREIPEDNYDESVSMRNRKKFYDGMRGKLGSNNGLHADGKSTFQERVMHLYSELDDVQQRIGDAIQASHKASRSKQGHVNKFEEFSQIEKNPLQTDGNHITDIREELWRMVNGRNSE